MNKCKLASCSNLTKSVFCSKSCAASHNNIGKQRNKQWIESQNFPKKIRPYTQSLRNIPRTVINGNVVCSLVKFKNCSFCKKLFTSRKTSQTHYTKCCSDICSQSIRAQNAFGIKRHIYNSIKMDSLWEVEFAKHLDALNIKWIRPDPLTWVDTQGITRKYYPDFLLTDFNFYVDTKNLIVQNKQKEKIEAVTKLYSNIIIGTLEELISINWPDRQDSNPHVSS